MPDEVKKTQFSSIKISKSIGFDSILNWALKELSNVHHRKTNTCYSGMGHLWIFVCIKVHYYQNTLIYLEFSKFKLFQQKYVLKFF